MAGKKVTKKKPAAKKKITKPKISAEAKKTLEELEEERKQLKETGVFNQRYITRWSKINEKRGDTTGPRKSSLAIATKLEELDCDPLEFAVMFLRGQETPQIHPFLSEFKQFLYYLRKYKATNPSMMSLCNHYELKAESMLGPGTWLDPKIRARIATDLLAYLYPKLSSITHKAGGDLQDPEEDVDTLTDRELLALSKEIENIKDDLEGQIEEDK